MSKRAHERYRVDIEKVCEKSNLKSRAELGRKANVPQSVLADAQNGHRGISPATIVAIFDATGCQPADYIHVEPK